jgi:hypothetical protein
MQCPEAALLWPDLAIEWLPETEVPATVVTRHILLLFLRYKLHAMRKTSFSLQPGNYLMCFLESEVGKTFLDMRRNEIQSGLKICNLNNNDEENLKLLK